MGGGADDGAAWLQARLGEAVCVLHLPEVGSTSTHLKQLAAAGRLDGPTLLFTDRQTAGRGTRMRRWVQAAAGAAPLDVALTYAAPLTSAPDPRLSLVVGALVAAALGSAAAAPVYVKWPNDLLAGEPLRKVGGILLETTPGWLFIGVGLNVNSRAADFPAELADRLTTLREATGAEHDLAAVQLAVARALAAELPHADIDALLLSWQELDRTAGARYTLQRGGRKLEVTARRVELDGALVLTDASGAEHRVHSYTELDY